MTTVLTLFALGILVSPSFALYDKESGVVDLTPNNFATKVKGSEGVWIVEFYAPWCGHCRSLAPEYQKAAKALEGTVSVGAVDCDKDANKQLCGQFSVKGFPTIKVFGADKSKPVDYNGGRTAMSIVETALKEVSDLVKRRLGGKGGSSGGSGDRQGGKDENDEVVELTDSNFDKLVLNSDDIWLVEFFAPWCGHCKNLAPEWKRAAGELKGKVKLGAVDATVHTGLASKYGVQGYPTIKYFPSGPKSSAEEYDGGRSSGDIVSWALDKYNENLPAPEVVQLTGEKVFEGECEGKQLCVVAFLPHILDSGASGREAYLEILSNVGDKHKKHNWAWLWSESMAQPELEDALGVGGFGYPALTVISKKKGKCAVMRGSFSQDGVNEFLRDALYGKASTATIKGGKLPALQTVEPWDGEDGELPPEDDIDLSDVDLDKEEL